MEFWRIDKRLKSMSWAERFLFGMNCVHNLYFVGGLCILAFAYHMLLDFPNIIFMTFEGGQSGLSYAVCLFCLSGGLLATSSTVRNGMGVIRVATTAVTRLVYWSICLIFLIVIFNNLSEIHGFTFFVKYHVPFIVNMFGKSLVPYVLFTVGWQLATIHERYGKKVEERETTPS